MKEILASGISPNAEDENGNTPISYALLYNRVEMAEFLISKGADINHINKHGDSISTMLERTGAKKKTTDWLQKQNSRSLN